MPSLFSRSHQTPKKDRGPAVLVANNAATGDRRLLGLSKTWSGQPGVAPSNSISEFGTVASSNAPNNGELPSAPSDLGLAAQCVFLTTNVPISAQSILSTDTSVDEMRMYGFLGGAGKNVILGLDEVARVIRDVGAELQRRALDTPLLFSNQSLELNQTRMRMLIKTFLGTVRTPTRAPTRTSVETFAQDIQFASDHELAWLLRWALSRMTRIREGTRDVCHGCIDWDQYEEWRGRERASKYPTDAFANLSSILAEDIYKHIISPLFSLLSKFAAHSHNSGLTPHALASYFAPLLFDIPTGSSYLVAHTAFVRAAAATEHMLLSYIRSTGDRDGLGVTDLPFRLKEWIKGYPAMVASDADLALGKPRRAARVVKCEVATRSVRAYSRDLILNAETWAQDIPTGWDAWDRVILKSRRGEAGRPKFSAAWRRKMAVKETLPLPQSRTAGEKIVYGMPVGGVNEKHNEDEEGDAGRFASLAGKEWNAFEESGFDAPRSSGVGSRETAQTGDIRARLQFDLNESAKLSVSERRETMDWSDFADGGFTRTEPFLTASLTFSAPVQTSITEWPKERDELRRRLHKTQKEATPFTHDTTPRVGPSAQFEGADSFGRITIEEAFVDCWTDFMMGTGWTDRDELTFKESSWALIEYKARAPHADQYDANGGDPRTSELYFLFEERVPLEYQMAVADPKRKKTLHSLFTKKKKAAASGPWDPRAVQRTDFDKFLDRSTSKRIPLSRADQSVSSSLWNALNDKPAAKPTPSIASTTQTRGAAPAAKPATKIAAAMPSAPKPLTKSPTSNTPTPTPAVVESKASDEQSKLGNGKPTRIFKSIRRVKSGSDQRGNRQQQREVSMDFELQSASGISSGTSSPQDTIHGPNDQDKWMDILVANGARKMDRDETKPTSPVSSGTTARLSRKGSTPSPIGDDVTPTNTHFTPLNTNNLNAHAAGLQPPSVSDHRSSTGSTQRASYQGSVESINPSEPDPAVFDQSAYAHSSPDRDSHSSVQTSYSTDDTAILPSDSVSMRRRPLPSPPDSPAAPRALPPVPILPNSPSYEGLLSPRPRVAGERDAIVSIVDHYRDSTNVSDLAYQRDSRATDISESDAYGGVARESFIEQTYASERVNSAYSLEEDLRQPPPIFDLTPGREPSPARYKHGEPLHFVGEEEEEEEDDDYHRQHPF